MGAQTVDRAGPVELVVSGMTCGSCAILGTAPPFAALGYLARRSATTRRGRLAVLAGAAVLVTALLSVNTGRWVNVRIATDRRLLIPGIAVLVVLLQIRQQSNAAVLMRPGY